MFLGTKIAFINMEGGLSVFDTESETREELLDNSSFVSAIFLRGGYIFIVFYVSCFRKHSILLSTPCLPAFHSCSSLMTRKGTNQNIN